MSGPIDVLIQRIALRLETLEMSERDASLRAVGKPDAIRYIRTRRAMPSAARLAALAEALQTTPEWLMGRPPGEGVPDIAPTRGASDGDGSIALRRINLAFAMGDGTNLDDYIEEGQIEFDANLLRAISTSHAAHLLVADGVGDSMRPTLLDSDMIVIDTAQTDIKADRIYAMSMYGSGAVKRLSPASRTEVEVISDNPDLASRVRIVPRDEIRIIGRVIWSGRRH